MISCLLKKWHHEWYDLLVLLQNYFSFSKYHFSLQSIPTQVNYLIFHLSDWINNVFSPDSIHGYLGNRLNDQRKFMTFHSDDTTSVNSKKVRLFNFFHQTMSENCHHSASFQSHHSRRNGLKVSKYILLFFWNCDNEPCRASLQDLWTLCCSEILFCTQRLAEVIPNQFPRSTRINFKLNCCTM